MGTKKFSLRFNFTTNEKLENGAVKIGIIRGGLKYLAAQLGAAPHYFLFLEEETGHGRPRILEDTMSYYTIKFIRYGKKISSIDPQNRTPFRYC